MFRGSSSVHHQELIHCTIGTVRMSYGLKTAFEQEHMLIRFEDSVRAGAYAPARKLSSNRMTYTSAKCTVNELLMMDRGTAPKHVEVHFF
jgi:hypothetical protein